MLVFLRKNKDFVKWILVLHVKFNHCYFWYDKSCRYVGFMGSVKVFLTLKHIKACISNAHCILEKEFPWDSLK